MNALEIGLIGDYDPAVTAHRGIEASLERASRRLGIPVERTWLGTRGLAEDGLAGLARFRGLWCVPASPYASMEGALRAIRHARESGTSFLGTCGGFQHALLEYARNVLRLSDAAHGETAPDAEMPLISPLSCALVERSGSIAFTNGSRLGAIYGAPEAVEEYHCSYGLNPRYESLLAQGPLRVCGRDGAGEVRAVELATHPFFIATLFQPERAALSDRSHPLVEAFVSAAWDQGSE